jgi:hypothetical protein
MENGTHTAKMAEGAIGTPCWLAQKMRERERERLIIGDCLERARGTTQSLTRGDTHNHHPTSCLPSSSPPSKQKHHFPSFLEHCMDDLISFWDIFRFAIWIVLGLLGAFLLIYRFYFNRYLGRVDCLHKPNCMIACNYYLMTEEII